MTEFEPELGQLFSEHPFHLYDCEPYVEAALTLISQELERVMENKTQEEYDNPFHNTGNDFECDTFKVDSYSWSDDNQPWNFKWKQVEISWYKGMGRGMSINCELSPDECAVMLKECLDAVDRL